MQQAEITPIHGDDFDRWLALWKGYQRFYEVDIPEAVTLATWARFLDPAEPMYAALARGEGKALGLVHSIYHRSTWTSAEHCYLQDLYVSPEVRGGGMGRALIEHVYADAQGRGAKRVHWLTHESNRQARRLYDRMAGRPGFIQYRKDLV